MKRRRDARGQQLLFDAELCCRRCGRWLRTDESVKRGYGPTCFEKVSGSPATARRVDRFLSLLAASGYEQEDE